MSLHILAELEQGTEAWHDQRRGLVTASVVGKLLTSDPPEATSVPCPSCGVEVGPCLSIAKKQPTLLKVAHSARSAVAAKQPPVIRVARNDTSRALTFTLAAERIAGWTEDLPMTSDMWRGVDGEPYAREAYAEHFPDVKEVGFMRRDEDGWSLGYSPDGLVGDEGLIEIKSPRAKTHVQTVISGKVPAHYMPQLQAGLLVSGRAWCDFVSYVGGLHLAPIRVEPDPDWFDAITAACIAFEQNAARIVADYRTRVAGMPTTERIDFNQVELKLA